MRVTLEMIEAARRAEFDYHQRGRSLGPVAFRPTPDQVLKVMLDAALALVPDDPGNGGRAPAIVSARKPRPRR